MAVARERPLLGKGHERTELPVPHEFDWSCSDVFATIYYPFSGRSPSWLLVWDGWFGSPTTIPSTPTAGWFGMVVEDPSKHVTNPADQPGPPLRSRTNGGAEPAHAQRRQGQSLPTNGGCFLRLSNGPLMAGLMINNE